jgi:hypothetical protein
MSFFNKSGKVLSYEKARKMIASGKYEDYHFEPVETEDGYLTGEYRLVKIQGYMNRNNRPQYEEMER